MKNFALRAFTIFGLLFAFGFSAVSEPNEVLRVHVPFQFQVGQSTLPPGDYIIQEDGLSGIVTLQNRVARISVALLSVNDSTSFSGKEPHLIFQRVNGATVLTQIQLAGQSSRIMFNSVATSRLR
ncbi:MAG TPA: hypothetical protein VF023_05955 [Bryobacteraceae bacterium]